MARKKVGRKAGGNPWKAAKEREAALTARITELENDLAQHIESGPVAKARMERMQSLEAEAKRWQEQAQRTEQAMIRRVEDAQRDLPRYMREIDFLRDILTRIASGAQLEQTFTVVSAGSHQGVIR